MIFFSNQPSTRFLSKQNLHLFIKNKRNHFQIYIYFVFFFAIFSNNMSLPRSSSSSSQSLRWIENFKGTTDFYREPIPFFPTMIIKISERDSSIEQIFETSLQLEKPGKLSYKDIQNVVATGIMSSSSSTANANSKATATLSLNNEYNIIGAATFIVSLEPDEVPFYLRSKTKEEDAAFHETFFEEIDVDELACGLGSIEASHNVHLERSINIFHDTNMLFIIIQKKKKKLCEIEKKRTRKRIFDSVKQMFIIRGGSGNGSGGGRNEDSTKLSRKGRETRKSRKG